MVKPFEIAVAPMMRYTHSRTRFFYRLMSPSLVMYTEMIADHAAVHSPLAWRKFFVHHPQEDPVVLQIGGSQLNLLSTIVKRINRKALNFKEININCGCPSDSVQAGAFGAVLMRNKEFPKVLGKVRSVSKIPITVKCRTGVDNDDSYEFLRYFVESMHKEGGVDKFIIHARKALLKGLSPEQNRRVPELTYDKVFRLKEDFPHLHISLNGGVETLAAVDSLRRIGLLDGVMMGRIFTHDPLFAWRIEEYMQGRYDTIEEAETMFPTKEMFTEWIEKYILYDEAVKTMTYHQRSHLSRMPLQNILRHTALKGLWNQELCNESESSPGLSSLNSIMKDIRSGKIELKPFPKMGKDGLKGPESVSRHV